MSESSEVPQDQIDAELKRNLEVPAFVESIAQDYPDESRRIIHQLPSWITSVDRYVEIDGFAQDILDNTEYISRIDIETFSAGIAGETTKLLEEEPEDVVFVEYGASTKSGKYFFDQIQNQLPERLNSRTQFVETSDILSHLVDGKPLPKHIFYCDDASNSGQQINDGLSSLAYFLSNPNYKQFAPVTFHLRLMRAADEAMRKVVRMQNTYDKECIIWDVKADSMPTVTEVLSKYPDKFQSHVPSLLRESNAFASGSATLGIFYHKLQDNLPRIFLGTHNQEVQISAGIKPLFQDSFIKDYPSAS